MALRPMEGDVLGMATMIFADEIVDPTDRRPAPPRVESTTASWRSPSSSSSRWPAPSSPTSTTTRTARRSSTLIERKAAGEEIAVQPEAEEDGRRCPTSWRR